MSIYNRTILIPSQQVAAIDTAYRMAGVTVPTRAVAVQEHVMNEPSAKDVAAEVAAEAINAPDADKFYEEALTRIQRAHAADALRAAFGQALSTATKTAMPDLLAQAAADLKPAFNKTAAAFSAAAKALPVSDPLNPDASIEADTTKELKTARASLTRLATYAGIYQQGTPGVVPPSLMAILPVVALPKCAVEIVASTPSVPAPVLNESQLEGTRAVRKLGKDARQDIDAALIGVAAGRYPGISIAFASPDELRERRDNADNAQRRKVNTDLGSKVVAL